MDACASNYWRFFNACHFLGVNFRQYPTSGSIRLTSLARGLRNLRYDHFFCANRKSLPSFAHHIEDVFFDYIVGILHIKRTVIQLQGNELRVLVESIFF